MMIDEKMEHLNYVGEFILLLLQAKNSEPVSGQTHLQKEMYFLQNMFPKLADQTDYDPHHFGPASEIVDDEASQLQSSGLLTIRPGNPGRMDLTPDGQKIAGMLRDKFSKKEVEKIEMIKDLLNDLTPDELSAFVYFSHPDPPELAKESVIYDKLLLKRRPLAMSIYRKDKISAQKAAQLAGQNLEEFLEGLKT